MRGNAATASHLVSVLPWTIAVAREAVFILREDLYKQVWTTAIQKLAKQYGLSDVGLSKTCRTHRIPTPPRGHWAKLAAGKRTTKPGLPKLLSDESHLRTISIPRFVEDEGGHGITARFLRLEDAERGRPSHGVRLSPLLSKSLKSLPTDAARGSYAPHDPPLWVSRESLDPVLMMLQGIADGAQERGWALNAGQRQTRGHDTWDHMWGRWSPTYEQVGYCELVISRTVLPLKVAELVEGRDRTGHRSYFGPSGRLRVRLGFNGHNGCSRTWRERITDGPHEMLQGFWLDALAVARRLRIHRLGEAVAKRDQARVARRAKAEQLARELDARRIKVLRQNGVRWVRSKRHAGFVEEVVKRAEAHGLADRPEFVEWLAWYHERIAIPEDVADMFLGTLLPAPGESDEA